MARKSLFFTLALTALGLLGGCTLLNLLPNPSASPTVFKDLNTSELRCLVFPEDKSEHIVRSLEEYAALFQSPQQFLGIPECQKLTRQPPVDLKLYSIVGQQVRGGGCDARFQRIVRRDDPNRVVIYRVVMQSFGLCEMLISSHNWIAVPRLPETYTVEFESERAQWDSTTPVPDLELQLEIEPTFAPPRWVAEFGRVPPFSLYSDGTVIYLQSQPESSEQLVRTVRLTESEKQALLEHVENLGFDRLANREPKPGEPVVADAPYTVLRMKRDAALKEVRVYFEYVTDVQAWQAILNLLMHYDHPAPQEYRAQQATLFIRKLSPEEASQYDNARVKGWPYSTQYLKPHKPDQQYEWAWVFRGQELTQYWQENGAQLPQYLVYGGTGGLYEIQVVPWTLDESFPKEAIEKFPELSSRTTSAND